MHMDDAYRQLATALAADGIRCQFQTRGQLVVSRQVGPIWPDQGNSFWVIHVGGRWYLFTWVPVGYRVPESADMAALCRTCRAHGTSAMAEVLAHIAQEFGLGKLTEDEAEAVCREMDRRV
jgi:hypothetical protein